MNRLFFYLLLLSIPLSSCITYIDDKEMDIKPKLVLHCYLVPQLDTTILVLTNSAPLFTSNPKKIEPVAHATVEISDDNRQWVKMEYDTRLEHYFIPQAQFPIKEGKTYYVRASASGFETVTSFCTVPYLREVNLNFILEESINDTHNGEFYPWFHHHGYLKWTDYPGEENYYMFFYKGSYEDYYTGVSRWYWYLQYDVYYKPCIYSDKGRDGEKMSAFMMIGMLPVYETTMLQTDRNCYLHELSIIDYDGDLSFFLLEPIQLYSNIKNGYGLFGAFVMKDYIFEFDIEE